MRSLVSNRQTVWFTQVSETQDEIDTIKKYSNPVKKRMEVSSTSGTPEETAAGIIPAYDRYITLYKEKHKQTFKPEEGDMVFVDRKPSLNGDGSLKMEADNKTPVVSPDYIIVKIIDTHKGKIARYGIKRVDTSNE